MSKPSTLEKIESKFKAAEQTWTENARRAMNQNPNYFVWWYTVKSIGLAVAVGVACYYAGKNRGMKDMRFMLGAGIDESAAAQAQMGRAA